MEGGSRRLTKKGGGGGSDQAAVQKYLSSVPYLKVNQSGRQHQSGRSMYPSSQQIIHLQSQTSGRISTETSFVVAFLFHNLQCQLKAKVDSNVGLNRSEV